MAKAKLMSHFRPHGRVQFDGGMLNHVTGEVVYPPSRTKQEFQKECDINNIIKSFSATGMMRHVSAKAAQGAYQDLPDPMDFQESLAVVEQAAASFMTLPAKVRDRFRNEPAEFLAFMADEANKDEMVTLGLREVPLPPPPPVKVEVVSQEKSDDQA